jgi:hypothetical protein
VLLLLVLGQSTLWTSGWVTMSMGEFLSYVWRSKQTYSSGRFRALQQCAGWVMTACASVLCMQDAAFEQCSADCAHAPARLLLLQLQHHHAHEPKTHAVMCGLVVGSLCKRVVYA